MNIFNFFLEKFFYKSNKNLLFYIILTIVYIILLIIIIMLLIKNNPFIFLFIYIILTLSFLIVGLEIGFGIGIFFIILNIFVIIFSKDSSKAFIHTVNIFLTTFIVYVLISYIKEVDIRKNNIEVKTNEIERKIIEKKEEYNKIKAQIEGNKTRIKNYTVLNELAQKLATILDKEEIYKIVSNYIVLLLNDKKVNFNFLIWNNELSIYENISERSDLSISSAGIKLYKKDSFDEWVEVNKHTLFVKNLDDDYRFKILRKDKINFKSLISIPLIAKQKIIGFLKIYSDKINYFDNDDVRILNYLGDLCTTVVQNVLLYLKTKELAIKDGLTGLYMRRYFIEKLDEEIKRVKQLNTTFSFLMIDIDHFKECNDTYGHLFGDKVLRILGEFLKGNLRDVDIIGRYGGEEFAVILPNTNYNGAIFVAERLRSNFEKLVIKVNENEGRKVTLSIGGVEYDNNMKLMEVINLADRALYHSKETGRNKVTFWEDIK